MTKHSLNQDAMIECINIAFKDARAVPLSEFWGDEDQRGIWIKGSEDMTIDGMPLLDPFMLDTREVTYQLGVHKKFNNFCEQVGWYCEQYDNGTLMVYEG